jgi:hypothetical protein
VPPPRAPEPGQVKELVYESSMASFVKLSMAALLLEIPLVAYALYQHVTLPQGGDPTLRYVSIGVPAFWAVVIPLVILILFVMFKGQSVTINRKSFIFRRGSFTSIIQWHEAMFAPPEARRWDRQFSVASKNGVIVIRSMFFPRFEEMAREVERCMSRRDSTDYVL